MLLFSGAIKFHFPSGHQVPQTQLLIRSLKCPLLFHNRGYLATRIRRFAEPRPECTTEKLGKHDDVHRSISEFHLQGELHVSDIVKGDQDHGVSIDRLGRLRITSKKDSHRRHKAALILTRCSSSLTEYDFRRVLGHNEDRGKPSRGGLETVLPVRHNSSFQRHHAWILIFSSPAQAYEYQKRAFELHSFWNKRSPSFRLTAAHAPFRILAQERIGGMKLLDYTLTTPSQNLSLAANLAPFNIGLQRAISIHQDLTGPKHAGERTYSVRLYFDRRRSGQRLTTESVKKFLRMDGVARGSPWGGTVVRVDVNPTSGLFRPTTDDDASEKRYTTTDSWRINFRLASDAKRFVRIWHRKPLPVLESSDALQTMIIKAECLF